MQTGEISIGVLTAFLLYTIYIAIALGGLSSLFSTLMTAVGASERMFEILDQRPSIATAAPPSFVLGGLQQSKTSTLESSLESGTLARRRRRP